ncbi:type II toxin-antitoxin system RelE/ParE family toxin (plasmid) [Tistrella mobilis]|uniref:type II toxin-antitoxin system RelE/ParE family toxin n=1 Tax=Tistrella mobilis TaxID=171437 RepID=UPI003556FCC2
MIGRVRFTSQAEADLLDIWLHLAVHAGMDVADRLSRRIETACRRLGTWPELGPARREIAEDARGLVIERWIAFYRIDGADVQIVRVLDGSRDLTMLDWPAVTPPPVRR